MTFQCIKPIKSTRETRMFKTALKKTCKSICALLLALTAQYSFAENGKLQAQAFNNLYKNVCLKNIHELGKLKTQLKNATQMPAPEARKLLKGAAGNAWMVPEDSGAFVLTLHEKKPICTIIAHHADAKSVEEAFLKLVTNPIASLQAKKLSATHNKTKANGNAHTMTYEWQAHKGKYKIVFSLSTTAFEQAEIQALGSIFLVNDGE
ncbi:MAG: hypothetical protein RL497_1784 [Pseudomonadota bacterium]